MADFDEILKKITENEDIMSKISEISKKSDTEATDKLPEVIDVLSPLIRGDNNIINNDEFNEKTDTPPAKTESISASSHGNPYIPIAKLGEKINKNSKLLLALKPYLSKNRCDVVDSIVKMAQVADLMKLMK